MKILDKAILHNKQNLTHLDLRNNRLERLPDQIGDLILLRELRVDYNSLKQLPFTLNRLHHLEQLTASQNRLQKLPRSLLLTDSKLEHLALNDNNIGPSIPSSMKKLQKLKELYLHNNPIASVPVVIGKLKNLQEFGLDWFVYLNTD